MRLRAIFGLLRELFDVGLRRVMLVIAISNGQVM